MAEAVEQRVHRVFVEDVATHQMTVVHDNGLHRHVKFVGTESSWNWFELVTWPGALCIRGDHGTYVFSREQDMFGFFSHGREINPSYWGEKCIAQDRHSPVKSHDAAAFEASVRRYVDEWVESYLDDDPDAVTVSADLRRRVVDDVLTRSDYGDEAVAAARDFSWTWPTYAVDPIHEFQFENVWESLTLESDNLHFLWCLYAIVWGIRVYESAGDTSEVTVDVPLYAHRPVDPLPAHWIHAGLADDQAAAPRLVETVAVAGGRL